VKKLKKPGPDPETQQGKENSKTPKKGQHSRSTGCWQPLTETIIVWKL